MPLLTDFDNSKCAKFTPNSDFDACMYYDKAGAEGECGFCKTEEFYRCLADTNRQIPLSYSSVQSFLTCHYLYYLQAIRGIQTKDAAKSSPLKMGTLWDSVLQKYLGGIDRTTGQPFDIAAIINKYEIDGKDVAKVRGLYKAYKYLDVQVEPNFDLQKKIDLKLSFDKVWGEGYPVEILITGYYDRYYPNHFIENKLSGRPDNYLDPWFIQSQVGTYFLADPSLESCTMEIARTPDLKSTGKNKEEDDESYSERVYQDIISRPSHYFLGWNGETKRYGRKFFRSEFDLEELKSRFIHIFREYWEARKFDGWFKSDRSCMNVLPGIKCDMISLCRHNNLSESIYQIRKHQTTF
jgi:hypothetical protein